MTKRILIVEDDQSLRKGLIDALTDHGYEIQHADNGEDGLQIAFESKPSLIVLDLLMPKMSGEQMLTKLREDEWGAQVPVIILSNVTTEEEMLKNLNQVRKDGMLNDYLVKSDTSIELLLQLVKQRLA